MYSSVNKKKTVDYIYLILKICTWLIDSKYLFLILIICTQ